MHFRRLLAVLVLALCAVGTCAGVARADGPAPTLTSDRATYEPGDAVQLTSSGWLPGAPVHVHVADAGGHGWSFDDDLAASADGSLGASVVLPSDFASDFVAVATSGLGGSATATFTSSSVPASTPTIVSDQNDYAPGSTVTLTGAGWLANESVHLFVNDQDGQTWSYDADLGADSSGAFVHQFQLPNWFVANYSVVATGFSGSSATTTFTDSQPTAVSVSAPTNVSVVAGNAATFGNVSVTMGGNSSNCTVTLGATTVSGDTGLPAGAIANFGNSPVTGNANFTSSLTVSTVAAVNAGTYTFHVGASRGANCQGNGTTNSTQQLTLVVSPACTAPAVTSQPTGQSITYGQSASFSATASGTSPSAQWQVSTNGGTSFSNLSGQTSGTLTLTKPPISSSSNQYRAVFTNGCGTATSTAATLTVTAKSLSITGAVANNRTYDSTTDATVDFSGASLVGVEPGDTVTINSSGYSASFANKNVGTAKPVTVTGVALAGSSAPNYTVSQPAGLSASISARNLTVTATGQNKVYDGTSSASVSLATDKLAGDTVSAAYASASFASKHAGTGKPVSVSGISIAGADAGNYSLTNTSAGTSADISQRLLSVSAVADSKVYDGTTASSGTPTITLGSLAPGDSASFGQAFANKNVGSGKTLIPSGSVSDGNSGDNYAVTFLNNTHGMITAKSLTVAGITASNKPYDGNTSATINVSGASLVGLVSGDAVTLNTGAATGAFTSASPGTCTVQISGLTITGGDSGNYALTQPVVTACIGAWYATGFYQPVGIPNSVWVPAPGVAPAVDPTTTTWNTAKGGSTIPLKFNLYSAQGGQERTSTADIRSFDLVRLACAAGGDEDAVDFATTGSTSLRYDGTAGQFIQNWKTPTSSGDTCYRVDVKFQDGSAIYAFFKLKR
jgi:hypothetical protein